jgi:hypothetical protein
MKKFLVLLTAVVLTAFLVPDVANAANHLFDSGTLTNLASGGSILAGGLLSLRPDVRQLEIEAEQRLSSFSGKANNYDGNNYDGDNYMGMDDDGLSFAGNGKSFLTELNSNLSFGFSITNALTTTQVIALTPTFLGTAAKIASYTGQTVDAVLTDGTLKTSVTAASLNTKRKIEYLQNFINRNPTRVIQMIIQADTDGQLEEQIVLSQISPFRDLANNTLNITDYVSPEQLTQKKAVIELALDFPQFQLDDQNVLLLPVVPGTVKVTWRIGAIRNPASELFNKAKKAYRNMTEKGVLVMQGNR